MLAKHNQPMKSPGDKFWLAHHESMCVSNNGWESGWDQEHGGKLQKVENTEGNSQNYDCVPDIA
jgi:hypothetical protein